MIIAEQLVLLALDPEKGLPAPGIRRDALTRGACACLLAELVLSRRVARRGRGIARLDDLPDFNPFLEAAGRALPAGETSVAEAMSRIQSASGALLRRLLDSLVARDVLHRQRRALLLSRYPVRSMQALREVHRRLHEVERNPQPTPSALALVLVADRCRVLEARSTPDELGRIRARIAELRRNPDANAMDLSLLLDIAAAGEGG
jgi:hypothetical protein